MLVSVLGCVLVDSAVALVCVLGGCVGVDSEDSEAAVLVSVLCSVPVDEAVALVSAVLCVAVGSVTPVV